MKTAVYNQNGNKIAGDADFPTRISNDYNSMPNNNGEITYVKNSDGTLTVIKNVDSSDNQPLNKQITKDDFIKNLLLGKIGNDIKSLCLRYDFDFDAQRRVFVAEVNEDISSYLPTFEEVFENDNITVVCVNSNKMAFICPEEDIQIDEISAAFSATFAELNMDNFIGIGCETENAGGLWESYKQAVTAVKTGKMISFSGGIWKFSDIVPELILSSASGDSFREIEEKARQINRVLGTDDIEIIQEFFKHDLNISETARCCYLHRNALIYRLDRIQKETGLNLRSFDDAVAMRIYIGVNRIIK